MQFKRLLLLFLMVLKYVKLLINRGLDVDFFAKGLSFSFASHNNFFEEIAKFRSFKKDVGKNYRKKNSTLKILNL